MFTKLSQDIVARRHHRNMFIYFSIQIKFGSLLQRKNYNNRLTWCLQDILSKNKKEIIQSIISIETLTKKTPSIDHLYYTLSKRNIQFYHKINISEVNHQQDIK